MAIASLFFKGTMTIDKTVAIQATVSMVGAAGFEPAWAHSPAVLQTAATNRIRLTPAPGLGIEPRLSCFRDRDVASYTTQEYFKDHFTWLRDKDSNLESPGSKPGMLPVTLSRKIKNPPFAFRPQVGSSQLR